MSVCAGAAFFIPGLAGVHLVPWHAMLRSARAPATRSASLSTAVAICSGPRPDLGHAPWLHQACSHRQNCGRPRSWPPTPNRTPAEAPVRGPRELRSQQAHILRPLPRQPDGGLVRLHRRQQQQGRVPGQEGRLHLDRLGQLHQPAAAHAPPHARRRRGGRARRVPADGGVPQAQGRGVGRAQHPGLPDFPPGQDRCVLDSAGRCAVWAGAASAAPAGPTHVRSGGRLRVRPVCGRHSHRRASRQARHTCGRQARTGQQQPARLRQMARCAHAHACGPGCI
jgi:hypothetical protein